jgi:hypothetical protein
MNRKLSRKMRKHLRKLRGLNIHHRRPISRCRRNKQSRQNTVEVPAVRHALWHQMFGNMTADEIAYELRHVWLEEGYSVIIKKAGMP